MSILDIILGANTLYHRKGETVRDRSEILRHYFKAAFWRDLLGVAALFNPDNLLSWLYLVKVRDICQFLEQIRCRYLLKRRENEIYSYCWILLKTGFVCHWMACLWNLLGAYEARNSIPGNWVERNEMQEADT